MYIFDKMLINPAFAGSSNWAVGTAKLRDQFSGMNGHPSTQTINFHAPIQKKHMGVGVKLVNDKIGITNNLNVAVLFSYHLNYSGGKLSMGLEPGIYSRKINYPKLVLSSQGDNSIPKVTQSSVIPDLSYGFYYQRKQMYVGVSQYHLLGTNFKYDVANQPQSRLYAHAYLIMGSVFSVSKNWSVEPSILVKHQGAAKVQLDLNTTLYYDDRFGAGIQYRTGDAVAALLKVNITENLKIAYAYDFTISKLATYSSGAHELIISYGIKLPPPPSKKEIHPRYYF